MVLQHMGKDQTLDFIELADLILFLLTTEQVLLSLVKFKRATNNNFLHILHLRPLTFRG